MEFVKRSFKRKMLVIALAATGISMVATGSALGGVSSYYGTYAGTYSGDDSGYWVAIISATDNVFLSYSTKFGHGDGGSIYYWKEVGTTGEFYSGYTYMWGTLADPIYIDSKDGSVTGNWHNPGEGESGTLSGSKVTASAYAGSYSGSVGGDETGSWQMTVGSNGYITGSVTIGGNTAGFEGGVHPTSYFAVVGTIGGAQFAVYGKISGSSVSGEWYSDDGAEGTISSGGTGGGGGGSASSSSGGGGGCFIASMKGN